MKYSKAIPNNGRLQSVDIYEGETIEKKLRELLSQKSQLQTQRQLSMHRKRTEYYQHTTSEQIGSI